MHAKYTEFYSTLREACHCVTLSTTNPSESGLGTSPFQCGEKQVTSSLSHGKARNRMKTSEVK
jgi:hypothetical protein